MINESVFHIDLLKRYQLLTRPGTHVVQVGYTVTDKNYIVDDHPRYLVPLRVVTGEGLGQILDILDKGAKKVPFIKVRDCFLTGALWDNDEIDEDLLPIKGEKVLATFDYVEDKLLCTHLELLPREELDFVSVSALNDFRLNIEKILLKNEVTI